ncbi:MAG: hypothetical protein IKV94_03190 [Clostridia bacterium]|nr:hypothetical protein [Clostridia bacterium]
MGKKNFFSKFIKGENDSSERRQFEQYASYDLEAFDRIVKEKKGNIVDKSIPRTVESTPQKEEPLVGEAYSKKSGAETSIMDLEDILRKTDEIPKLTPVPETMKSIKTYNPFSYREKKNVIFFVIENSKEVCDNNGLVSGVMNKIISSNKDSFFRILTMYNEKKISDVLDFATLDSIAEINKKLNVAENDTDETYISDALRYIWDYLISIDTTSKTIEFKDKKYDFLKASIIFIGTGRGNIEDEAVGKYINLLKLNSKVSTIKYICLKDKQAINVSAMGFPVIGHINPNFYD